MKTIISIVWWFYILLASASASAQVSGISSRALVLHVRSSQLPAANGSQGIRIVTDALSSSSCTIGGGSVKLICFDNGSWVVVGLGIEGSQGPEGPPGQSATIDIGSVTTGVAGSSASIVNSGTSLDAIFDFTIPRGDKGETGDQGIQGIQGIQGSTGATGPPGTTDHGLQTGLADDDHSQYALLAGRSGGQSLVGGTGSTDDLTLDGSAGTAGAVLITETGRIRPGISGAGAIGYYGSGVSIFESESSGNLGYLVAGILSGTLRASTNIQASPSGLQLGSAACIEYSDNTDYNGALDTRICRGAAGRISIDGSVEGDSLGSIKAAKYIATAQSVSIPDNGNGGTRATSTLTPTTSYALLTCNDSQGCDISISETGAVDGQSLRIVCASANVCGFADTSGVTELSGLFDMGQYDSLSLSYSVDRWIEIGRSNN